MPVTELFHSFFSSFFHLSPSSSSIPPYLSASHAFFLLLFLSLIYRLPTFSTTKASIEAILEVMPSDEARIQNSFSSSVYYSSSQYAWLLLPLEIVSPRTHFSLRENRIVLAHITSLPYIPTDTNVPIEIPIKHRINIVILKL